MTVPLTVSSWNVLAQTYLIPDWYPKVQLPELTAGRRCRTAVNLISGLDGDVIALQEVEPLLVDMLRRTLPEWDIRYCPREGDKPDGCLTMLRPGAWTIANEYRFLYRIAARFGHIAHVLDLEHETGATVRVINTHVRWQPPGTPLADHIGVFHARELVKKWVTDAGPVILAADLNDHPGGPVRHVLSEAGFTGLALEWATAYHSGIDPTSIDVIATAGGADIDSITQPHNPTPPLPTLEFPSDHLPLSARILVPDC